MIQIYLILIFTKYLTQDKTNNMLKSSFPHHSFTLNIIKTSSKLLVGEIINLHINLRRSTRKFANISIGIVVPLPKLISRKTESVHN